jgi:pimeloyl-ACP methyl ester carboxylesterase
MSERSRHEGRRFAPGPSHHPRCQQPAYRRAGTGAAGDQAGASAALFVSELALDHPDLVASLTLVSGVANRSPDERAAVAGRLRAARADLDATFHAAVERWFSPPWRAAEPELAESVVATLRANRPESYLACYAVFATADAEIWPRLPGLHPPMHAITGSDDPGSTPAMAVALAARVPRGRSTVVPGARHLLPLERPTEVVDAVLAQVDEYSRGALRS